MTRNQLSVLGAAVLVAAGATTLALWPGDPVAPIALWLNGPTAVDVQQLAPANSVPVQGASEICDTRQIDGGNSGQCAICEAIHAYDAAPDAGGSMLVVTRVIECSDPYDPGSDIAQPGPIMFGMGSQSLGKGNIKGGGTVAQQTTQARVATASPAVSALDPNSLGCACAAADPARTDCQWQGPNAMDGTTPDPVQCPLQLTMRPGTCTGADCVPKTCWETELRRAPGDSMPADCLIPPDAGAPGPDAGPDAAVLLPEHP